MIDPVYADIRSALRGAGQATPCLVLDLDRYSANIDTARANVAPGLSVRVVAKSLACLPMLDLAMQGLGANGMMTFSATMLRLFLWERPEVTHLMGKPLPVAAVADVLAVQPEAAGRVIWLVDTGARAAQLAELAGQTGQSLRVAVELDVGLHRGGVPPGDLAGMLGDLAAHPGLIFEGVMGYEPHLAKLPGLLRGIATRRVQAALAQGADLTRARGGTLVNTGGSMTFANYTPDHGATEVALGSVLAKPTDFDLSATEAFQPALFIATPILKYLPGNPLPGLDWLPAGKRRAHIAIYGGYWKAKPVWPAGYNCSGVFGHSSNQEMWAGPVLVSSPVDDFALLRPTQSEAVLPEFGEVVVHSKGQIIQRWATLPVAQ